MPEAVLTAVLHLLLSVASASRVAESMPRLMGLEVRLEPVASSPNRMSLGIHSASIRLTWPSQHR